jgi:hypothetical protein
MNRIGRGRWVTMLALCAATTGVLAFGCSSDHASEDVGSEEQALISSLTVHLTRIHIGNNAGTGFYSGGVSFTNFPGSILPLWECPSRFQPPVPPQYGDWVPLPEGQPITFFCDPPGTTGLASVGDITNGPHTRYTLAPIPPGTSDIPVTVAFRDTTGNASHDFDWHFTVNPVTGAVTAAPIQGNATAATGGPNSEYSCARGPDAWMLCWKVETPGACVPTGLSEDFCNGDDDDCDGSDDEDYVIPSTCGIGACASTGTKTCMNGAEVDSCQWGPQTGVPETTCNGVDDDCNGSTDELYVSATTTCGVGACASTGTKTCMNGGEVDSCQPGTPTAETFDLVDNDCDGWADDCSPGQTDWWCCPQAGQTLSFNVVPTTDQEPPALCSPLSISPGSTCSLRAVFGLADVVAQNGCSVTANVAAGRYAVDNELRLGRGRLRLNGPQTPAVASIEPVVPAGTCPLLCQVPCSNACHPDPFSQDNACLPSCDATCNPARDNQCVQFCDAFPRHRLINARQAPGSGGSLDLVRLRLSGGDNPEPGTGGFNDSAGGAIAVQHAAFSADHVLIEDNWARGFGSGLALDTSNATIVDSVIRNNGNTQVGFTCHVAGAIGDGGGVTARGGGIYVSNSSLVIDRTAITGNISSDGGGIAAASSGNLTVRNSTISGNGAPGRGGGLLTSIDTTLEFVTLAYNAAGYRTMNIEDRRGGGFAIDDGVVIPAGASLRVFGSIIGENFLAAPGSGDCSLIAGGPALARGYNFITAPVLDCAAFATALDRTGSSVGFINNATFPVGFTPATSTALVHTLESTSPSVNFYPVAPQAGLGAPACPPWDQRGLLRDPQGCDIGAYETNGRLDSDRDGIADEVDPQPFLFSSNFSDIQAFGFTSGSIVNRNGHVVVITDAKTGVNVSVHGAGGTPVQITACGVTTSIAGGESRVITCPRPTDCLFARETLTVRDRARVSAKFFSGSFSVGSDANVLGRALATGNGFLGDRGRMNGARLGGVLSGYRAGVQNGLVERAFVPAQTMLQRAVTAGTAPIEVPREGQVTLAPGSYGAVTVRYHGRLKLSEAGIYRFASLFFEPDAFLDVPGGDKRTVIAASGNITFGDRLILARNGGGTLLREDTLFYSNGSAFESGFLSSLIGDIEAPAATIQLRDRATINGCVGGRHVTVGFDGTVGDGAI